MDRTQAERMIRNAVLCEAAKAHKGFFLPAAVSNRHIHLDEETLQALFGAGAALAPKRALSQPGQYACEETVAAVTPKSRIERIRVLGPLRRETQLELSITDARKLGVTLPVRMSGDLHDTPGCELVGPKGSFMLSHGVIAAARHVHMSPKEAACFGVSDGDRLAVRKDGDRPLVLENVVVRAGAEYSLELHLDTDEANAAGIDCGDFWEIVSKETRAPEMRPMKVVTEADVVDCSKAGIMKIIAEPQGVVTQLAWEKAHVLGVVIEIGE